MKYISLILVLLLVFAIGCAKVSDADTSQSGLAKDGSIEPIEEMPAEVLVEEGNGAGLEPVVIEIVAARQITPFNPKVKVGQEIIWVNKHVDGEDDREYRIKGDRFSNFESPLLKPGDKWSYTFEEPGDYQYTVLPGAAARLTIVGNAVRWFKDLN
ncbi:MAG: hypothetical protein U9R08_06055 [Nanoarchaeota archaeon]|nr:hypothetical protein [Nanoarchaeota archaeon]